MSSDITVWDKVKNFLYGSVITSLDEIQRLIPDSIMFGSLFMYILTQNISFGVFALFLFESMISHRIIAWGFSQTVGNSRSDIALKCRPGFRTPRFEVDRIFARNTYPSYGMYSITSMATYLGLSVGSFKNTMDSMGGDWGTRYPVAVAFIIALLSLFILVRYLRGCDSLSELLIAGVFGALIGFAFYFVNSALFGKEGMNFLGLPYMVEKQKDGTPIYVCSTTTSQPNMEGSCNK
jgi:hypothetical protein